MCTIGMGTGDRQTQLITDDSRKEWNKVTIGTTKVFHTFFVMNCEFTNV